MCLVAWMQRKYPPMAHMGEEHEPRGTEDRLGRERCTVELEMAGGGFEGSPYRGQQTDAEDRASEHLQHHRQVRRAHLAGQHFEGSPRLFRSEQGGQAHHQRTPKPAPGDGKLGSVLVANHGVDAIGLPKAQTGQHQERQNKKVTGAAVNPRYVSTISTVYVIIWWS